MYQVKAQTARSARCSLKLHFYALTSPSMFYKQNKLPYLLNLIDTPVFVISLLSGTQVDLLPRVMLISPGRFPVQWLPAKVHSFLSMQARVFRPSLCRYFTLLGKEVLRLSRS